MATARDIIKAALRKIQVLGTGQSLDANEAQDALDALNDMLAVWSAENDYVFFQDIETFNLTGAGSYTIGSGGDFNTARPNYINAAYVSDGSIDYTLKVIGSQEYARITQKDVSAIPEVLYYDNNFPLARIYLYPVPTSVNTITLYTFKQLSQFTSLDTNFNMPPEYKAALIYNLAMWIAPEYERAPTPDVKSLAKQTKDAVSSQNKRNDRHVSVLDMPSANAEGYNNNIYTGWYT